MPADRYGTTAKGNSAHQPPCHAQVIGRMRMSRCRSVVTSTVTLPVRKSAYPIGARERHGAAAEFVAGGASSHDAPENTGAQPSAHAGSLADQWRRGGLGGPLRNAQVIETRVERADPASKSLSGDWSALSPGRSVVTKCVGPCLVTAGQTMALAVRTRHLRIARTGQAVPNIGNVHRAITIGTACDRHRGVSRSVDRCQWLKAHLYRATRRVCHATDALIRRLGAPDAGDAAPGRFRVDGVKTDYPLAP